MKRSLFKNYLALVKVFCFVAMLCAGLSLSAEEVKRRIVFQNPASDMTNVSDAELMLRLTQDEILDDNNEPIADNYNVISVQNSAVTLKSAPANSTATYKWGSIYITDGFIKFNLRAECFISKVLLMTIGSSTPDKIKVNGSSEYTRASNYQDIVFSVNQKASSITIECAEGSIDFEATEIYFSQPMNPEIYNEAGEEIAENSTDITVGQLLNIISKGADKIDVKYNGIDKYTLEGENVDFRPMEPGEYTFSGTNELGTSKEYTILVTVNQPAAGQRLTLVTDESGLIPGYLYVYQIVVDNETMALSTQMHETYTQFPKAIKVNGDGSSYQNEMETMLLGKYRDGWSLKLTNMGKYLAIDPAFVDDITEYKITFVEENIAELSPDYTPTYKFCYSSQVKCFSVTKNYEGNIFGRLYRVDPISELPIEEPEDSKENQTVTVNGEKCVTRTLTVSFPAPANKPASNYVLRYGEIDLTKFELIGSDYIATATLPYIKGAELMIIGSDSDGAGSFSLGNPWKDLESTVVEQPIGIPAVITINVATGKASFRQALNFESETPCELEISDESHPSGELIKESDGRYYYVIEDYVKDIKTDSNGAPIFSEADKADVNYNVTPVFKVAGAATDTPARAVARDAEPYNVYTLRGTTVTHSYTSNDMSVSGIEAIRIDSTATPQTYYTIDGINLGTAIPTIPGLYIRVTGTSVTKILIK